MIYKFQVAYYKGRPHVEIFQPRNQMDFDDDGNVVGGMVLEDAKRIVCDWYIKEHDRISKLTTEEILRGE